MTLEADDTNTLTWYIDAAFAVHANMRSHTGAIFTMGKGAIIGGSNKQKVNSRSSTEAEIIGVDDKIAKCLWMKRFLEWQGFKIRLNIVYQDNTSSIKLEENGKESSGKRTRHFDIKYFYVTDLVGRNEVKIEYCSTDEMIADYMTKPLVGGKFKLFRDLIMNLSGKHHRISQQECVGQKIRDPIGKIRDTIGSSIKGVKRVVSRLDDKIKRMAGKPRKTTNVAPQEAAE